MAALGCMAKLNGVCDKDADCKTGESCSADGLCLRSASSTAGGDAGNSGAGDAGNSGASDAGNSGAADAGTPDAGNATAAAAIDRPPPSTFVPPVFPVSATATTDGAAIADVTFLLNAAGTDAGLGSAVVTSAAGKTWSNTFSIDNPAFNGGAVLRAVAPRTAAPENGAAPISLSLHHL